MQRLSKSLVLLCVGLSLASVSCFRADPVVLSPASPPDPVTVTMMPQLTSVAAGSSQQFRVTPSDSAGRVQWNVSHLNVGPWGSITPTGFHVAPPTPPIYDNSGFPALQGHEQITVVVYFPAGGGQHAGVGYTTQDITVTAPSVTAGFVVAHATVPLGGTFRFQPYAVGAVDTSYSLRVQGARISGGSGRYGSIVQNAVNAGLYTAPLVMPASGKTVTVTVVSTADPTKTADAVVTLQ